MIDPRKVWLVGGGDIRLRLPLLRGLQEEGYTVGAVGSEDGEAFRGSGVPYWNYILTDGFRPRADRESFRQLCRLFSEHRPDIVHAFDTKPGILAPMAARKAGVAGRVCTITGMGYLFSSGSPRAWLLRPVYRHLRRLAGKDCGATVFQNSEDRDYYREKRLVAEGRDWLVRGSGIDVEAFRRSRPADEELAPIRKELDLDGKLVVLMVSRLVAQKGVLEYLEAARRVGRERSDMVFLLGGPAPAGIGRRILSELSSGSSLVRYLGERDDVPALLAVSDIFVLPSYYREGVPRVLLEAGAMGLPLIATDEPGCRDVVKEGWNGHLIPSRDVPALVKAILRLAASDDRKRMGERSRRHVRGQFDLGRVVEAYSRIYRAVLAGKEGS